MKSPNIICIYYLEISWRDAFVLSTPEGLDNHGDLLGDIALHALVAVLVQVVGVMVVVEVLGQVDRIAQALDYAVHIARVAQVLQTCDAWVLK